MSSGCDRLELDAVIGGSTRHATSLFSLLRPSCYSFFFTKGSVRQPLHPSTKKPVGDVSNSCEQLNRRLITVRDMSRKTLHEYYTHISFRVRELFGASQLRLDPHRPQDLITFFCSVSIEIQL